MAIKNIAPNALTACVVGGTSPENFGVGTVIDGPDEKKYIMAKIIPGTASVTGARQTLVVPYVTGNVHTKGEYTHDLTDTAGRLRRMAGIQKFSMMTAVTHYGLVQIEGSAEYLTATTNPLWLDGNPLSISTTDNRLNASSMATTSELVSMCAIAEEDNIGVTVGTSVSIRLLGVGIA